ncbi:MAG: sensor histidine kinase/response regulator [Candidatus Peregrinibacteria bacterium Greene0416_19]|nr:MAG: sensor histidine kinase/response regulator [Candidatus Peregrinibacteria bacterium Greene0416_19]
MSSASESPGHRILLVQHDQTFRTMYSGFLQSHGFEILEATDGKEGFSLARDERPDIVIADQMMPGMTGIELLTAMRQDASTAAIPVIIFSLAHNAKQRAEVHACGASDYVSKGMVTPKQMLAKIRALLPPPSTGATGAAAVFRIRLPATGTDVSAFRKAAAGSTKNIRCKTCRGTAVLELTRNDQFPSGVFAARLVCGKCWKPL